MTQIEKSGLFFILLGVSTFRDGGWVGALGMFFLVIGLFVFQFPIEAHLTQRATDLCQTCGTKRVAGEDKCRVCGTSR